jgi:hypothetical protein
MSSSGFDKEKEEPQEEEEEVLKEEAMSEEEMLEILQKNHLSMRGPCL